LRKDKVVSAVFGEENALAPSDLYSQQFRRALLGGYAREEVDAFLRRVADVMESLITQVKVLKGQCDEHKARLDEYRKVEATLRSALVSTQKFGEDILDSARREAQALVEEANAQRAQAQMEASKLPVALSRDIDMLDQQRQRFRTEMLSILETHRSLLDSLIPEARESLPSFHEVPGKRAKDAESSAIVEGFEPEIEPDDFTAESGMDANRVRGRGEGAPS
jgi:cell division initiation protein